MTNDPYMNRALRLASFSGASIKNGAYVGAVIVANGKIIGEGAYKYDGGPHAEVNAVNSVSPENKKFIAGSTIYVSLEPCSIFGRTPPCADLLIKEKFGHVVIGCIDFTPGVCGNGIERLRQAGISVTIGTNQEQAFEMSRFRQTIVRKQRPYITLKQAISADGYVGRKSHQVHLTGTLANTLSHQWRAEHQAILVGINTVLTDNPSLDVRHINGPNPIRIVLNPSGRAIDRQHAIYKSSNDKKYAKTLLAIDATAFAKTDLPDHVEVIELDSKHRLQSLLDYLLKHNIGKLLVEGGPFTLSTFVQEGLWDEYRQWTSPLSLGKEKDLISAASVKGSLVFSSKVGDDQLDIFRNH